MVDVEKETSIERLTKLAEENNRMLRKLHRSLLIGRIFRIIYWVIIIGVAVGVFYFLQPYYEGALNFYDNLTNTQEEFGGFSNLFFGQDLPPLEEGADTGATE